ncbi:MAG: hypothetical protein IPM51_06080 [Sphingobacteriaceae bacterium]|nr:hypothetical protein [Sphingobacteriaceae bacterium]
MRLQCKVIQIAVLILFFPFYYVSAQVDFTGLKEFYSTKTAFKLNDSLYTKWSAQKNAPFCYVYVSKKNQVQNVFSAAFIYCGTDSSKSFSTSKSYEKIGYSTFNYKTFGTSEALITENLMSFPSESASFIVMHELTHNYIKDNQLKIPYVLNEAMCEVLGIYFCGEFFSIKQNQYNINKFKSDTMALKQIYRLINSTVLKINADSMHCNQYCEQAEKEINKITVNLDQFYKGRFNYPVNTAYLLKNQNYSTYFFDIEKLFLSNKNFSNFIHEVKNYANRINEK